MAAIELMFSDEEVKDISGFKIGGGDHVEVTVGCTSHRYGDTVGTLRVYLDGNLIIKCGCPDCNEDQLIRPAAFVMHSQRETGRKWKNSIWVIANGKKVSLVKTALLKYYNRALENVHANRSQTRRVHQDEFVRCTICGKQRRFHQRTKEECRAYHDALMNANWKCSDTPNGSVQCRDKEERASRRVYKRCSRDQTCKGCTSCVCFGCGICRFTDCSCQNCVDFMRNVEN